MGGGIRISKVRAESQTAGRLQTGDWVVSCNGKPVSSPSDLSWAMEEAWDDQEVLLGITRNGKRLVCRVSKAPLGLEFSEELAGSDSQPAGSGDIGQGENFFPKQANSGSGNNKSRFVAPQNSEFETPRKIAGSVIVIGKIEIALSVILIFFGILLLIEEGLGASSFALILGLLGVWSGLLIILVGYGLIGIFNIADDSSKTAARLGAVLRQISDRDEKSRKSAETGQ